MENKINIIDLKKIHEPDGNCHCPEPLVKELADGEKICKLCYGLNPKETKVKKTRVKK